MTQENNTQRPLSIILYQGKKYFVNHKLKQMLNINNPNDYIQY